jgi:hypothetical protein
MTCDHPDAKYCEACRPSDVPDGRKLLDAFKRKHRLKSDEHALALMAIEAFNPERRPRP